MNTNAPTFEQLMSMRPAQLRAMADSMEAAIMREPIDARRDEPHTQIVALRCAASTPKRKRAPYLCAFLRAQAMGI